MHGAVSTRSEVTCADCGLTTNAGALVGHRRKNHEFACKVSDCAATKHKALGLCVMHWSLDRTMRLFGLTLVDYFKTYEKQRGLCAICRTTGIPRKTRYAQRTEILYPDHDAATMTFRGLLCNSCNIAIGHLRHDPKIIARALEYCR